MHTTALVQGDTLGGGLESALLHHKVIFERGAQAGFPGGLFNLFPGMGAWNLTIRKAGFAIANDMILSGQIYTADQLYRRGLVDLVVEDGEAKQALERGGAIASSSVARNAGRASGAAYRGADHLRIACRPSSSIGPSPRSTLNDRDLRLMERLARAQVRKVGGADEGAVEEIKRMELDTAWGFERTGISEWSDAD